MATYITLGKYTHQGITTIKEGPKRLDNAKKAAQAVGANIRSFYLTLGQYDFVAITEAPNDEAAAKLAVATGSAGNVTTETLRAFTEDEFRKLVSELP